MVAATRDLDIPQRMPVSGHSYGYPVKAGVRIFKRAMVGITADKLAVPVGAAGCVAVIGLATNAVDNRTGVDGEVQVRVDKGVFRMPFAAAAPSNIRAQVFALDDQTLQLTNANSALLAGTLDAIDAEGVWIRL